MRNIVLPEDIEAKLAALAAQNNETIQKAADHVLREYFSDKEEEERRWEETLAADASIDQGKGIEGEKVLAWLKSWGTDSELPPPQA